MDLGNLLGNLKNVRAGQGRGGEGRGVAVIPRSVCGFCLPMAMPWCPSPGIVSVVCSDSWVYVFSYCLVYLIHIYIPLTQYPCCAHAKEFDNSIVHSCMCRSLASTGEDVLYLSTEEALMQLGTKPCHFSRCQDCIEGIPVHICKYLFASSLDDHW